MKDSASARYLLSRIGEGLSTNGLLDVSSVSSQTENVVGSWHISMHLTGVERVRPSLDCWKHCDYGDTLR